MKKIAIFASGNGSNAQNIADYFDGNPLIKIQLILTNNPNAFVLERAKNLKIAYDVFNRDDFYKSDVVMQKLEEQEIDFVVLAGFLWLIPENLIQKFPNKILNIHPALLPKYGGKGMYGSKVHEAVHAAADDESGITIHYVNKEYDEGMIIFQARTKIDKTDTPDLIAEKIHALEYEYFPQIIERCILSEI